MILAVDVDYQESSAKVAGVAFRDWSDHEAQQVFVSRVEGVAEYEPGRFYKRELPCILSLLREHDLSPDVIVIDGFVYLDGVGAPGLGKHLYDSLGGEVAVVGVAKRAFRDIDERFALYRGESKNPLYITAEGIDLHRARKAIEQMDGEHRNPTLLKKADQACRGVG